MNKIKFIIIIILLIFCRTQIDAKSSIGINVPLVGDKVYFAPYFDFSTNLLGFYFDIGLMYTQKNNPQIDDKKWLGYFLDLDLTLNIIQESQFRFKPGIGYSFHHLIHVDQSLRYHQMPLSLKLEYKLSNSALLFYRLQYPLLKSGDMNIPGTVINNIGIGLSF